MSRSSNYFPGWLFFISIIVNGTISVSYAEERTYLNCPVQGTKQTSLGSQIDSENITDVVDVSIFESDESSKDVSRRPLTLIITESKHIHGGLKNETDRNTVSVTEVEDASMENFWLITNTQHFKENTFYKVFEVNRLSGRILLTVRQEFPFKGDVFKSVISLSGTCKPQNQNRKQF